MLLGYPKLLSGDYTDITRLQDTKYKALFGGTQQDAGQFKRYYLNMPFFPFRTLCPRDLSKFHLTRSNEFNASSPIYPAHTQIDVTFKKRNLNNLINYMLPYNLPGDLGTNATQLTAAQRRTATSFNLEDANDAAVQNAYDITAVNVVLNDLYLPVMK